MTIFLFGNQEHSIISLGTYYLRISINLKYLFFSNSELKNTQDQIIQLQHIIQLLPLINRDTLYVLLQFLGLVAEHADDRTDDTGRTSIMCLLIY